MKVLVNNYSSKTVEITCCRCKSILEINREDVKYDFDRDVYIKCPLCGVCTYLNDESRKILVL